MNNRFGISALVVVPLLLSLALALNSGCTSSTSTSTSNGQSTVTMQSQLTTSDVDRAMPIKVPIPAYLDFDSIVITNAIVFVSDLYFFYDMEYTEIYTHDQTIKTGPFMLIFDSSGTHVITSATIPPGTYDRVKFEFHKPDKNADAAILTEFPELENGGQTYSVWIYGYTVKSGVRTSFSVVSNRSENLTLHFEDKNFNYLNALVLNANATTTLAFELDPRLIFHVGGLLGQLFDPRDLAHHQGDIDSNLLVAIRIVEF